MNENEVKKIIEKYEDLFISEIDGKRLCPIKEHSIDIGSEKPICLPIPRVPVHFEEKITQEVEKLLKSGLIRESTSPWRSIIVAVQKPDKSIRMCIDYRALNEITKGNSYPIPRIDETLDALSDAKAFSVLDATSGYYQIAMAEKDISKTAFSWKQGFYEFTRMPFGLKNAPATFQEVMDIILQKERGVCVIPYLDDIIIFSPSVECHARDLEIVLNKIKAAGLSLNKKKCKFFKHTVKYLGFIVSNGKIHPDPEKITAINEFVLPKTISDLRSFLGLANFCSPFIKQFASLAAVLNDVLKGESKRSKKSIEWTEEQKTVFSEIKKTIKDITYKSIPNIEKPFILTTDASNRAYGAVLTQINDNGIEEIISCFSKKFDKAQENYSVTDKELLGIVKGIEHFKHYLIGKEFLLKTDHASLKYLKTASNDNTRLWRMALKLQDYQFRVEYIKGETNIADIFSRPNLEENQAKINNITILDEEKKLEILKEYHLHLGHGSKQNMNFSIRARYKWPKMGKDINEFVERCEICSKNGSPHVNTMHRIIKSSYPNELWEMDLIGRIPDNNTSKFIFVAIDHFSKWMEAKVIQNKSAEQIKEAIEELIIKKHGIPKRLLSDVGLEFKNSVMKKLCNEFKIEQEFASPNHHQTVGAVERANQSLFEILKRLSEFGSKSWKVALESAVLAYNLSFHRALNTSPYIFKYGKLPLFEFEKILGEKEVDVDKRILIDERNRRFEEYATRNIQKRKIQCPYNLSIGDNVLVYKENLSGEFAENWHSGYIISDLELPDAYWVCKDGKKYRLNKTHVKPNKFSD